MKKTKIIVDSHPNFANKKLKCMHDAMKKGKYTDFDFTVRKKSFSVHMVVLSACSEFFLKNKDNLSDTFSKYKDPVINGMLEYCYTGQTSIDTKHYKDFKKLAKTLKINSIADVFKTIDQDNCFHVLRLSNKQMSTEAMSFIQNNFETLYKKPDFLNLPAPILTEILTSDNINISSEEDVVNSVKLWVTHDKPNRKDHLVKLMKLIKLPLLSIEFIVTEVLDLFSSSPECIASIQQEMKSILPDCNNVSFCRKTYKLVVIGSNESDTIEILSGRYNSWSLSENFQFSGREFTPVLVDDWIMIIGGNKHRAIDSVNYINLKDGQKYALKPLNQARFWFPAVALRRNYSTYVYAIGGHDKVSELSSVERWNSQTKNWETNVAPLLQAVCYHSASVINDKIYVTGGSTKKNGKYKSIADVQMYSVESNSWSYRAPMIKGREQHASIVIKERIFVGGGFFTEENLYLDSVESYDSNANLWTFYCNLPHPLSIHSLCVFQNMLLCIGGNDGNATTNNVWEYNDISKKWDLLKSLSKNRGFTNAFLIPYDSLL
ncbi:kelch-like protein 7 [Arctopsyche grandis]|uniref:kelch-like protein 7 n=1 Tax=Arctopsyche grandis TaxID=121162 RepID=UPI00406D91E4